MSQDKKLKKNAMKELREARKEWTARASANVKEQKKEIKAIKDELAKKPSIVPELAAATGMLTAKVLWYIATMKKYGEISEEDKSEGYFRYALIEKTKEES